MIGIYTERSCLAPTSTERGGSLASAHAFTQLDEGF